jgi:N-succinyldiaminopimelate aminotransferase
MFRAPLAPSRWAWKPSIFTEMTMLSQKHNSINLGQGFPDWNPPGYVVSAAQRSISGAASPLTNQYSRSAGLPRLCQALASHYSERIGVKLDWQANVAVTVGATEGIFASCMALLNTGDECIIIEPYYDSYPASVRMAGATPVCVPMVAPFGARSSAAWRIDWNALDAAASPRTKMIIVNSPHNPTGKLFDGEELHRLAAFAQKHNSYVLADEVYEHITFDGLASHHIAQIPGMWDRTLTLGSAGKTFSATGWKVRFEKQSVC